MLLFLLWLLRLLFNINYFLLSSILIIIIVGTIVSSLTIIIIIIVVVLSLFIKIAKCISVNLILISLLRLSVLFLCTCWKRIKKWSRIVLGFHLLLFNFFNFICLFQHLIKIKCPWICSIPLIILRLLKLRDTETYFTNHTLKVVFN